MGLQPLGLLEDVFMTTGADAYQVARWARSTSQPTTNSSQCCRRNELVSKDDADANLLIGHKIKLGPRIEVTSNQNKF